MPFHLPSLPSLRSNKTHKIAPVDDDPQGAVVINSTPQTRPDGLGFGAHIEVVQAELAPLSAVMVGATPQHAREILAFQQRLEEKGKSAIAAIQQQLAGLQGKRGSKANSSRQSVEVELALARGNHVLQHGDHYTARRAYLQSVSDAGLPVHHFGTILALEASLAALDRDDFVNMINKVLLDGIQASLGDTAMIDLVRSFVRHPEEHYKNRVQGLLEQLVSSAIENAGANLAGRPAGRCYVEISRSPSTTPDVPQVAKNQSEYLGPQWADWTTSEMSEQVLYIPGDPWCLHFIQPSAQVAN